MSIRRFLGIVLVCLLAVGCEKTAPTSSSVIPPAGATPPAVSFIPETNEHSAATGIVANLPIPATRPNPTSGGGGTTPPPTVPPVTAEPKGSANASPVVFTPTTPATRPNPTSGGGVTPPAPAPAPAPAPTPNLPINDTRPSLQGGTFVGGQWTPMPIGWAPPAVEPEIREEPRGGGTLPPQQPVPEPETVVLFTLGAAGAAVLAWRRREELAAACSELR